MLEHHIEVKVVLLEFCDEDGNFHAHEWDEKDGVIFRSREFDSRNQGDKEEIPSLR